MTPLNCYMETDLLKELLILAFANIPDKNSEVAKSHPEDDDDDIEFLID